MPSDNQQHNQLTLTVKSTSGTFSERFNAENRAQKVLDDAINHFGLSTGGNVTYRLVRESDRMTLNPAEKLSDLGIHDGDVLILQPNQAQDG